MQVVLHEAVRKKRIALVDCRTLNLLEYRSDSVGRHKYPTPLVRAECQEISMQTKIVECLEVFGLASEHTDRGAKCDPVRLKPDTTDPVRLKPDTAYVGTWCQA